MEVVRCRIISPHVRTQDGPEPFRAMLDGQLELPLDEQTEDAIKRGWLEVVDEPTPDSPPTFDCPHMSGKDNACTICQDLAVYKMCFNATIETLEENKQLVAASAMRRTLKLLITNMRVIYGTPKTKGKAGSVAGQGEPDDGRREGPDEGCQGCPGGVG